MYGYICPDCGAHLAPNERCDCREEKELRKDETERVLRMLQIGENGQMSILFEEAV